MLKQFEKQAGLPAGIDERWTEVGGLRVRFLHGGTGSPLVLVHGLLGYSFNWRRILSPLAQSYEVFVPDLPGSGFSECSSKLNYGLSASAERLIQFLNAVGIESADVVASSYGGATAMLAASTDIARFRRLVLVSPANPWSQIGRKRLRLLRVPAIAAGFPAFARWARPAQAYFVRRMYGDPARLTDETLNSHFKPLARPGVLEHGVGIVKTWREDMELLKAALPNIAKLPTLLIWGSRDRTVDPRSALPLSSCFASARIEVMEGAGHLPYEECPEEFTQILMDFLNPGHSVQEVT